MDNNISHENKYTSRNILQENELIDDGEKENINSLIYNLGGVCNRDSLQNSNILCELSKILNRVLTKENEALRLPPSDIFGSCNVLNIAVESIAANECSLLDSESCQDVGKGRRHSLPSVTSSVSGKQYTDYFLTFLQDSNWSLSMCDYSKLLEKERNRLLDDESDKNCFAPITKPFGSPSSDSCWPLGLLVSTD